MGAKVGHDDPESCRRKPLGMAEVSLTIGGVDEEHLRAAGVEMSYNEVTVTRRVFRDGSPKPVSRRALPRSDG